MSITAPIRAWRTLTPAQRKSGVAGWLGWMFDGLDMHLYTLVSIPYVALLLQSDATAEVKAKASLIQAAFLAGWALGGGVFGVIGDRLGRSRALVLTILTYSVFCGLGALAQTWWQLLIFRFVCALGIGGEWAVGAALISESLPKPWRPWIAAVLQTAVNLGILLACLAGWWLESPGHPNWMRAMFLVGLLPALITLWIRRSVPEPEEWRTARLGQPRPRLASLFAPGQAWITWRVLLICAAALTAHWAYLFWHQNAIRGHPDLAGLGLTPQSAATQALAVTIAASVAGNFIASALAVRWGYRVAMAAQSALYGVLMALTFGLTWSYHVTLAWLAAIGVCHGFLGLFTMCLPPLFPTLLRTTGAGFCYNIGRLVAAGGTVFFGLFNTVQQPGRALLYASLLFVPATLLAWLLPSPAGEPGSVPG